MMTTKPLFTTGAGLKLYYDGQLMRYMEVNLHEGDKLLEHLDLDLREQFMKIDNEIKEKWGK